MNDVIKALFYGLVEGVTEWLPVSSTGHIILVSAIPGFNLESRFGSAFWDFFMVIIQLGAILAVILKFFKKLNPLSLKLTKENRNSIWKMWLKIIIGCIPAGLAGVLLEILLNDEQTKMLNSPIVVACTLIIYGVFFIIMERYQKKKQKEYLKSLAGQNLPANPYPYKYQSTESLSYLTCLYIGLFQMLSIIPGTSRSGVTILSALLFGASRSAATEYSFFLSIPIMLGASLIKLISFIKDGTVLTASMNIYLWFGIISAFLVSLVVIKKLMGWVKKHTFEGFGYYRICLGAVIVVLFCCNVIA